jgi:hypothetical protein
MPRIVFFDEQWQRVSDPFVGQWAISEMPEHLGWAELRPQIDLPAIHAWGKLLVIADTD